MTDLHTLGIVLCVYYVILGSLNCFHVIPINNNIELICGKSII